MSVTARGRDVNTSGCGAGGLRWLVLVHTQVYGEKASSPPDGSTAERVLKACFPFLLCFLAKLI